MESEPIRVVLIEDHTVVRQGFCALLESQADMEVVGQASGGEEGLELIQTQRPDVGVVDLSLPDVSGLDVIRRLALAGLDTRVLVLTMHADTEYALEALRDGAAGYVLKDADAESVAEAIRTVHQGRTYVTPSVKDRLVDRAVHSSPSDRPDPHATLTDREKEILRLIAKGHTNRQIAEMLAVSIKTIQAHRANLMNKLDIHDQTSLVKYAIRRGMVSLT